MAFVNPSITSLFSSIKLIFALKAVYGTTPPIEPKDATTYPYPSLTTFVACGSLSARIRSR